jgi:hypothetical protein
MEATVMCVEAEVPADYELGVMTLLLVVLNRLDTPEEKRRAVNWLAERVNEPDDA